MITAKVSWSLCTIALLLSTSVQAARVSDSTHITMSGDILETPCTIEPESRDQTINMGTTSLSTILKQGVGKTVPFEIRLKDCLLQRTDPRKPDWQQFVITFNGPADGNDFALAGIASGAALRIVDGRGMPTRPGMPLPASPLYGGSNVLHYTLQLVGDGHPLREGAFHSVISFQMNYF